MAISLPASLERRGWLIPVLLWALALYLIVWSIWGGRLVDLATIVAIAYVGALLLRWPMVGVVLLLVGLPGQREGLSYLGFLPRYVVPVVGTVNATDIVLAFTLLASVRALVRRRERPRFLTPLLLLFGVAAASSLGGALAGEVTIKSLFNGFRNHLLGYTIYLAFVGVLDTRRKLHALAVVLVALVLLGLWDQARSVFAPMPEGVIGPGFAAYGGRPNVRSTALRVAFFVPLFSLLSLAQAWQSRRSVLLFMPLGVLGAAFTLLTLYRQVTVMLVVGTLGMLLPAAGGRLRRLVGLTLAIVVLLNFLSMLSPYTSRFFLGDTPIRGILYVAGTVLNGTEDSTIGGRERQVREQTAAWLDSPSPLLGYGFTVNRTQILITDLGVTNTLALLGPPGVLAVLILWLSVARAAYRACGELTPSMERGFVLGAFACWVALLVGYSLGLDFFTYPVLEAPVVMTLVDRGEALARGDRTATAGRSHEGGTRV